VVAIFEYLSDSYHLIELWSAGSGQPICRSEQQMTSKTNFQLVLLSMTLEASACRCTCSCGDAHQPHGRVRSYSVVVLLLAIILSLVALGWIMWGAV
jgi:hypothetical protein